VEVVQGRRRPREGFPGEEVQESRNMRGGPGVGTHGRRFSRRESLEEKEDQGRSYPGREKGQGRTASGRR